MKSVSTALAADTARKKVFIDDNMSLVSSDIYPDGDIWKRLGEVLDSFEIILLKMISGEIVGYDGKRYELFMMCVDEELIRLCEEKGLEGVDVGIFTFKKYSNAERKYTRVTEYVKYIRPNIMKAYIRRAKKRAFELLQTPETD